MTQSLDKFYTLTEVAKKCIQIVGDRYEWIGWNLIVEPSAGNGSFLNQIPSSNRIGMDIEPENDSVIKQDFFTFVTQAENVLVIGNPPFGRVSSMAVKFFNHAAKWCDVIAFIVPRTFRRISIQNRLNLRFHLIFDEEIPTKPCAFYPPMMAKCCFQIWEKNDVTRSIVKLSINHKDWNFIPFSEVDEVGQPTPPNGVDFAIRAYGGKCGEIVFTDLKNLRPKSWHWIKSNISIDELIKRFNSLDYSICFDTARQNSLGKAELVQIYNDSYG